MPDVALACSDIEVGLDADDIHAMLTEADQRETGDKDGRVGLQDFIRIMQAIGVDLT